MDVIGSRYLPIVCADYLTDGICPISNTLPLLKNDRNLVAVFQNQPHDYIVVESLLSILVLHTEANQFLRAWVQS
jgi:hypothetical protein